MTGRESHRENFDLLAMGELLLRLSPPGNDRITRGDVFEKHIGGAELNVAAGVSLLGLRTGMISEIPDSAIGEFAKNKIRYLGVSDDYLIWDSDEDARLGVYYYESARFPRKPQVVYDRKHTSITKVDIDSFPEEMFSSTRCFHISGITLALNEKAYEKINVVDRIGSGDAYCGGVLYGLLSSDMDCGKALAFGNACSAVKNTIPGDLPSSDLKEIEYIIEDHNTTGRHAEMNR